MYNTMLAKAGLFISWQRSTGFSEFHMALVADCGVARCRVAVEGVGHVSCASGSVVSCPALRWQLREFRLPRLLATLVSCYF